VTFQHVSGLPRGLELFPNGEIYGAPKESGTFPIKVRIYYSLFEDDEAEEVEFTLTVHENTDYYVDRSVDPGYRILQRVDNMTAVRDQIFEIQGGFSEFIDFWLDGERLRRDIDYAADDGSTVITIRSQTFRTAGNGTHTIAAEFRVNGDTDNELKKAAQNYILRIGGSGNESGSGSEPGGSEPGGNEPGGNEPGGNEPGGNEPGGNEPGGSEPGGSEPGGNEPGGSGSSGGSGGSGGGISAGGGVSASVSAPNITVSATVQGTASTAVISAQTLGEAGGANRGITVTSPYGNVAIDAIAVNAIGRAAAVSVTYTVAADANSDLTVSLTISRNGSAITNYGRGIVKITVPYVLPSGARWTQVVPYLRIDGGLQLVMGGYNVNTRCVEMYLRHLSDYVIKLNNKQYESRGVRYDPNLDWAAQRGLLDKYINDGRTSVGIEIARGDFLIALMKALGIQPPSVFTVEQFSDVNGEDAAYIRAARELGIVGGVGENRFDPDRPLTRGELFQIANNLIRTRMSTVNSQKTNRKVSGFADADTVPEWLKPTLGTLLEIGVVQGDGTHLRVKDSLDIDAFCAALQKMASDPVIRALN
jgi:hypothetical protein